MWKEPQPDSWAVARKTAEGRVKAQDERQQMNQKTSNFTKNQPSKSIEIEEPLHHPPLDSLLLRQNPKSRLTYHIEYMCMHV
jgi:hypothetical protein